MQMFDMCTIDLQKYSSIGLVKRVIVLVKRFYYKEVQTNSTSKITYRLSYHPPILYQFNILDTPIDLHEAWSTQNQFGKIM
jgi:hypothetical protein